MTTATENKKVVLVVGAGDATGGAIAKRFAREGLVACVTRRSADKLQPLVEAIQQSGGEAHGFACDARKEEEVIALIEQIESEIGPIEALVFNIGANVPCSILEETARKYFKIWEMACFSGFLNAREVAKRMVTANAGPSCSPAPPQACVAQRVCRLRRSQAWHSRAGAKHGPGTGTAEHPRRSRGGRWRHRH